MENFKDNSKEKTSFFFSMGVNDVIFIYTDN